MTEKERIIDLYKNQTFTIMEYPQLTVVGCAVLEDDGTYGEEFIFTVPVSWLVDYMSKEDPSKEWDWEKVHDWLQNEYIYDDSIKIFEQAVKENVCVNLNF